MATHHSPIKAPFVRSPYNYDTQAASDETGLECKDPSLTSQAFKEESDINYIVEKFTRNPDDFLLQSRREPQYGDFTQMPNNYHDALNQVRNADAAFMDLPASLRSQFDNDPGKLLAFCSDGKNYDKAVELGLAPPREDLSTGSDFAHAQGKKSEPVGKSGQKDKPSVRTSNEGVSGDD